MKNLYFAKLASRAAMVALSLYISIFAAHAQVEKFPNFNVSPTGKGLMLMNQKGTPDYAILIEGGTKAEYDWAVGGLKVRIADGEEIIVYNADAKLYAKTKTDAPETLMKNYRATQLAQIEIERKQKIKVDQEFSGELPVFDMRQGKDAKVPIYTSFWSFPLSGVKSERRIYLGVIIGDSILILRKDLLNGEDAQDQSRIFTSAHKTLTLMPPQKVIPTPKKLPARPGKRRD